MPSTSPPSSGLRWGWAFVALAAVLLLIAAAVLIALPEGDNNPAPPDQSADPLVVTESATLTVPDTLRMESHDFEAVAGSTYLLQFEATTTKPGGTSGDAMYFGASLACGGPEGGTLRSVGGTQNVRTGEEVTLRNQFLLTIEETGQYSCRLTLNSPNEDAAAAGTDAEMSSTWSATRLEEPAFEAAADERLPRVVDAGDRAAAFRYEIDMADVPDRRLHLLGTVHVTTCTGTNGSREDGKTWCDEDDVDLEGSTVEVTYRADVLDDAGEVCESTLLSTTRTEIVRFTHHRVLSAELPSREPLGDCGDTVLLVVAVQNDGPAPVVIHRSNSTLLALTGD